MSIRTITKILADEHRSIALEEIDHEGECCPLIAIEGGDGTLSFHFENVDELRAFLSRCLRNTDSLEGGS